MDLSTIRNQNYVRQMLEIQRQFEDEAGEVLILALLGGERKKKEDHRSREKKTTPLLQGHYLITCWT